MDGLGVFIAKVLLIVTVLGCEYLLRWCRRMVGDVGVIWDFSFLSLSKISICASEDAETRERE
jgi:hypothetical protein